ncbi:hypothetical protein [Polynucleobacter sp. IMCC 30228]|uniref:hypothetical protein n=1 Tax=Polynucleobacter sp. IMCC 30228 TaxID=2781011 RepID=UPI001F2A1406|nr:hypothetical protein [Polynucleobacter sp. IMCC 30228]MCE7527884.1 hypothetical protein [Polynucleobacter sp. IMCC 30228]
MPAMKLHLHSRAFWRFTEWLLYAGLALTLLVVFVPLAPEMPSAINPLDPSWVYAMNQAVEQGLVFGQTILFTFGPYASIFTKAYHPATDHLMVFGATYLAILFFFSLVLIVQNRPWIFLPLFAFVILSMQFSYDALFFAYALVVGIYCYQITQMDIVDIERRHIFWELAVLFSGFGLYPLIKGTLYILYFGVAFLSASLFLMRGSWRLAVIIPASICLSLVLFWAYAGQPLLSLPSYFGSLGLIIAGYSEAMSLFGNSYEIIGFILVGVFMLALIVMRGGYSAPNCFLLLLFALYLMISFKSGFVRHDGHAIHSAIALIFACLCLLIIFANYFSILLLLISIMIGFYIDAHHDKAVQNSFLIGSKALFVSAIEGVKNRLNLPLNLKTEFNLANQRIRAEIVFPKLEGTVDTYPYDQARLIAAGFEWNPRPVFQSYAAYNADLMRLNQQHLLKINAPENLIFKVATIDERLPSLDDGLSWPTILENYRFDMTVNDFLILKKKRASNIAPQEIILEKKDYFMGDWVTIPNPARYVFTEITISPSFLGRLINIFYKTSEIRISLRLKDGTTRYYRLIPAMAKAGFLLSPLVENSQDFHFVMKGGAALAEKKVESFSIGPVDKKWEWEKSYQITFKEIIFSQP